MNEKVDKVLLDVDEIVFEQNTPVCKTRIMHSSYGYYYIEMGNGDGYRLDSITYDTMVRLIKLLIAHAVKKGLKL